MPLEAGADLVIDETHSERALYVVEGSIAHEGATHEMATLAILHPGTARIRALEKSRIMIVGGAPMDGPRHIDWKFVSSSKERIEKAKADWREDRFPKVPGDDQERIPLPE